MFSVSTRSHSATQITIQVGEIAKQVNLFERYSLLGLFTISELLAKSPNYNSQKDKVACYEPTILLIGNWHWTSMYTTTSPIFSEIWKIGEVISFGLFLPVYNYLFLPLLFVSQIMQITTGQFHLPGDFSCFWLQVFSISLILNLFLLYQFVDI